jgi:hypothetical protein
VVPEIRKRLPSTLKISTVDPLGGADRDPRASIINIKKRRRWDHWEAVSEIRECPPSTLKMLTAAPWEVLTEIRERSSSTLINVDGGPPGGGAGDLGAPTINAKKCQRWAWAPVGGIVSIRDPKGVL